VHFIAESWMVHSDKELLQQYYIILTSLAWRWGENKTYRLAHHSIPPLSMNAARGLVAEDRSVFLFCGCCPDFNSS